MQPKVKDIWSRSVSLHWTPSYDGNSPITKFIVTYWRDQGVNFRQQDLEVSSAQHFTLVRDLQPGTHYVLNVVAENAIGKSEASRTVTFTTNEEEPEAPPLDVNAVTQGPTTVLVSWKAPDKVAWNGDIEGYYIGFKPKTSPKTSSFKKVGAASQCARRLELELRERFKQLKRLLPLSPQVEQKNNVTHEYILQGLNRGTEYVITVQAYNHAGSGPSSPQSLVMTRAGGKVSGFCCRFCFQ